MGVSSDHIQLTELKMIAPTFLLIAFLCVPPPQPVAGGKLQFKHLHQDMHKLMALVDPCAVPARRCRDSACCGCAATGKPRCQGVNSPCENVVIDHVNRCPFNG